MNYSGSGSWPLSMIAPRVFLDMLVEPTFVLVAGHNPRPA